MHHGHADNASATIGATTNMPTDTNRAAASLVAIAIGALLVLSLFVGLLAYEQVGEGHVGVHKEWGAVTGTVISPGAHFITPIQDGVQHVEVRPRTYTMSDTEKEGKKGREDAVVVQTVNGTTVRVDVTVRYRVNASRADRFVEEWNTVAQLERRLIRPTVRSDLRDEAAAIPTTEIYTARGRERLADVATAALNREFGDEPVTLEAVQVREVDLPPEYDKALDEKEIAKQRVAKERYRVQQERQKKKQRIINAEGKAESIRVRAKAYRDNPIILRAEYIKALRDGSVFVVPDNGSTPVLIDAQARGSASGNTTSNLPPTDPGDDGR